MTERYSGETLVRDVIALMKHASKSASYKPALLKAIAAIARRQLRTQISLLEIGTEFTRMYWNQTVVYHLRQNTTFSKKSEAVRLVEAEAARGERDLGRLPHERRRRLDEAMADLLQINVLKAFHVSKPPEMPNIFGWRKPEQHITLQPEIAALVKNGAAALDLIGNYFWAEFLEKTNRLVPRIIQKVASNAAKRTSLTKYVGILRARSDACFYCERRLDGTVNVHVDHVIPWSFLFEDPLWDLVLACESCNTKKSDSLPVESLVMKLIERNEAEADYLREHVSFMARKDEIEQLYRVALSVGWPRDWKPTPHALR